MTNSDSKVIRVVTPVSCDSCGRPVGDLGGSRSLPWFGEYNLCCNCDEELRQVLRNWVQRERKPV